MEQGVELAPRDVPFPSDWSVRRGLAAYLAENGFKAEDYNAKRTPASFLGINFSVPNTPNHRRAIMQHDLHHVATGFGTDPAGEGEISAWELRNAGGALDAYVGGIVRLGAVAGLLFAPRRTYRAYQAAANARCLFHDDLTAYEGMLDLTVGELRERLGVPEHGLATHARGLHSTAPCNTPGRGAR